VSMLDICSLQSMRTNWRKDEKSSSTHFAAHQQKLANIGDYALLCPPRASLFFAAQSSKESAQKFQPTWQRFFLPNAPCARDNALKLYALRSTVILFLAATVHQCAGFTTFHITVHRTNHANRGAATANDCCSAAPLVRDKTDYLVKRKQYYTDSPGTVGRCSPEDRANGVDVRLPLQDLSRTTKDWSIVYDGKALPSAL
jgi:hypothetical protein